MNQLNTLVWSHGKLAECLLRRGFGADGKVDTMAAARHLQAFVPPGMTLTRQHIENWCSGRNVPSMRYLPVIRYGLGVEDVVKELFEPVRANA